MQSWCYSFFALPLNRLSLTWTQCLIYDFCCLQIPLRRYNDVMNDALRHDHKFYIHGVTVTRNIFHDEYIINPWYINNPTSWSAFLRHKKKRKQRRSGMRSPAFGAQINKPKPGDLINLTAESPVRTGLTLETSTLKRRWGEPNSKKWLGQKFKGERLRGAFAFVCLFFPC